MQSTMLKSIHHTISTLACLALAGTLAACGNNGSNGGDPEPPHPDNAPTITFDVTMDLTRPYAGAFPGGRFPNAATATAKGKCTTPPTVFTYSSVEQGTGLANPDKVEVDASGVVTYKAAGTYTIKASTADTTADTTSDTSVCAAADAKYTLEVTQADADFTFDSSIRRVGIEGGTTRYLVSLGNMFDDSIAAMGGTISYTSANADKATVNATTGVVTGGDNTGEVRITATYRSSKNYKETTAGYDLEISDKVPKSISFGNAEVTADYAGVDPGRTYTQTAAVSVYEVGSKSQCTTRPGITYSSSDVSNAAVHTTTGEVTYTAAGTYIITATTVEETSGDSVCFSISSAYILTVNKATADLTFDSSTGKAGAGGGMTTNLARLRDATGNDSRADMGGTISYSSADITKATVDATSGEVTAVYAGTDVTTVVIYARYTGSRNYNNIIGSATTKPYYTLSIGRAPLAISFTGLSNSPTSHDVTYGGSNPGVEITSITTDVSGVDANGYCPTRPVIAYSNIDTSTEATTDKITFSDVTPGAVTYKAAGTYTITASTLVAPGCTAESSSYTLNVAKANATLSFSDGDSISVGPGGETRNTAIRRGVGGDSITAIGGIVTYYSADTGKATVNATSGTVTAGDSTGNVTIYASFTESPNYNNIGDDTTGPGYTLSISDTLPIITFDVAIPAARIYAGADPGGRFTNVATARGVPNGQCTSPPAPSYSVTDKLTGELANPNKIKVGSTTGEVTYKAAGDYTITATTADDTSGDSVCKQTSNVYDLIVNKATATLVFDNNPTDKVGSGGGTVQNRASLDNTTTDPDTIAAMGGTITYSSADTALASVDATSGEVTAVYAGTDVTTVVIYARYTESPNYHDITGSATTEPNYTLSIGRDRVSITFNNLSNSPTSHDVTYGGSDLGVKITNITADATVDAGNGYCPTAPAIDYISSDNTKASVNAITGDVTYTAAGSYRITATTTVTAGCAEADATYDLIVNKANATLSFSSDPIFVGPEEQTQNPASLVTAPIADTTAGRSGIISYYSDNTGIATVDINSGTVTAKENTGDVTIYASFTGNNYNDITGVNRARYTLRIRDVVATIRFTNVPANDTTSRTYAGVSGATFTNAATVRSTDSLCTPAHLDEINVRYTSSDPTSASVDATTGVVTYTAASPAGSHYTITADDVSGTTPAACGVIAPVTYNLIVNKANLTTSLFASDASVDVSTGRFVQLLAATLTGVGNEVSTDILGAADNAAISYSTTSTDVSTTSTDVSIDASTDRVTSRQLDTTADVTIYARFTGSRNYENTTDSYTLKIRNSVPVISFADITGDATSVIYAGAAGYMYTHAADVTATAPGTGAYCIPQNLVVTYDTTADDNAEDVRATVDATGETAGRVTYYAATPEGSPYTITASTDVTAGCAAASKSYELTVDKATPTFTFASSTLNVAPNEEGSTTENTADSPTITPEGVGGEDVSGTISYISSNPDDATVDPTSGIVTVKTTDATDVVITATYSGSSNYKEVTDDYTLIIGKSAPLVSFDGLTDDDATSVTYAGSSPTETGPKGTFTLDLSVNDSANGLCSASGLGVTYTITGGTDDPTVDAASGEVTYYAATEGRTAYTITARTAVTANCAAVDATYTLNVAKANLVSFAFASDSVDVSTGRFLDYPATPQGIPGDTATGVSGGSTISYFITDNIDDVTVDRSTGRVTSLKLDSTADVTIDARFAGSNNYKDATASYILRIRNSAPTLGFTVASADVTYAGANPVAPAGTYTQAASITTNGFCSIKPDVTYSSIVISTEATTDKIAFSDVTPGELTYTAAAGYRITASTVLAPGCAVSDDAAYDLIVKKADAGLAFGNLTTTVGIGKTITNNAAMLTSVGGDSTGNGTLDGVSISYSSTDTVTGTVTDKATVDASGVVTGKLISSTGGVTIIATYPGSDNYKDVSGEYQLTVTLTAADLDVSSSPIKKLIFSWGDVTGADHYRLTANLNDGNGYTQVGQDVTASNTGGTQSITRIVPLFDTSTGTQYRLESCDRANACEDSTSKTITQAQLNRAIGYIKASNTGGEDYFGYSLSLSADGRTMAVGAIHEDSDATGVGNNQSKWSEMDNDGAYKEGAVYVFTRDALTGDWTQDAYIKASSNTSVGQRLGTSLSLSANGDTLAVGTEYANTVYVFTRDRDAIADNWTEQVRIQGHNTSDLGWYGDSFGISLSLSANGDTLAVGAIREDSSADGVGNYQSEWSGMDNNDVTNSGAVYVFSRTSGDWSQKAYIKASNTGARDFFGISVSLDASGTTLAVGAHEEGSDATGVYNNPSEWSTMNNNSAIESGAVYVFTRTSSTSRDWTQDAYIKASNTGNRDRFGDSLSLSANGDTLAVGARYEDSNATGIGGNQDDVTRDYDAGAVYVFTRPSSTSSTSRDWTQDAYIKASNTGGDDFFGYSLSLSADGDTLAVGAHLEDSKATGIGGNQSNNSEADAGAVYLY